MISGPLIHPTILGALAAAGHKALVLITDAHYAASTAVNRRAPVVLLNLEPGSPTIPRVVELVAGAVAIEARASMRPPGPEVIEVQREIDAVLGLELPHRELERGDFYAAARSDDLALCIVTGDLRRFGNVLLTIGVTAPPQ